MSKQIQWINCALGFVVCSVIRFIPFRPPNIEPILAMSMPLAKAYSPHVGFFFAFLNIVIYDVIVGKVGIWTVITASAYGLLGLGASLYLKNRENNTRAYIEFAILATIFYDAVTGLSIGPLFFNQSFTQALLGQIPFTILHLLGNVLFASLLSPAVFRYLTRNTKPIIVPLFINLNLKKI